MALMKLLNSRPEKPYASPRPLHFRILKSCEQLRVISWDFQDGTAKPLITKTNTVAAITDGETVTKVTIFEEYASNVLQGGSYIMRRYEVRGTAPPYYICVTASTEFFRAPILSVREDLYKQAEDLLHPPAPLTPLKMSTTKGGLITVQGEVLGFCALKVLSGKQLIPLKKFQLREDGYTMTLCLWREAAIPDFNMGDHINLSHMKLKQSSYGPQLNSTPFTRIETKVEDRAKPAGGTAGQRTEPLHSTVSCDKEPEEATVRVNVKGTQIMQIPKKSV